MVIVNVSANDGDSNGQAPDYSKVTHIRHGVVCPVVQLKRDKNIRYIITFQTLTGVSLERIGFKHSARFVPFDVLLKYYANLPVTVLFNERMIAGPFVPIVYINDAIDGAAVGPAAETHDER